MPGFRVQGIGDEEAPADDIKAYYTYTWTLPNIFQSGRKPPLIYLKDMTLPTFSVEQEKVRGASLIYKYASNVIWEDVKVTWYDTKGLLDIVLGWRKSVWAEEKGIQSATAYKLNSSLMSELPDGKDGKFWQLYGSWPSTIRYGDLTYTQSEVKVVDVTVTYDWAKEVVF